MAINIALVAPANELQIQGTQVKQKEDLSWSAINSILSAVD
jgi:hypothetical protein